MNLPDRVSGAVRSAAALTIVLGAVGGTAALSATPAGATATSPATLNSPADSGWPGESATAANPSWPGEPANPSSPNTNIGWLRLAHLSPNTPAVDVYVYAVGNPTASIVLKHVAYGTESPYERVASGSYTVAMRAAGASPSSKPVLSTVVNVVADHAYTVAGMGPFRALRLQVLQDRLAAPAGRAMVRIIEASLTQKRVSVRLSGTTIARGLLFGTASQYLTVLPGTVTAHVAGSTSRASSRLTLAAGSIHTLVVLDSSGHLAIQVLADAAGTSAIPTGAANTGFGGTAALPGPGLLPWVVAALVAMALTGAGAVRLRSRHVAGHAARTR
jgi:Domain of unknown function (DUF4397)